MGTSRKVERLCSGNLGLSPLIFLPPFTLQNNSKMDRLAKPCCKFIVWKLHSLLPTLPPKPHLQVLSLIVREQQDFPDCPQRHCLEIYKGNNCSQHLSNALAPNKHSYKPWGMGYHVRCANANHCIDGNTEIPECQHY